MSVTAARGFRAAGVTAGLKASGGRDVALVVNDGPSDVAAAVFTRNRIKAAPVLWSQQVVADGRVRAVVLNSGGANACTGPDGFADTHGTAETVQQALHMPLDERRVRHQKLLSSIREQDIHWWRRSFLDALEHTAVQPD